MPFRHPMLSSILQVNEIVGSLYPWKEMRGKYGAEPPLVGEHQSPNLKGANFPVSPCSENTGSCVCEATKHVVEAKVIAGQPPLLEHLIETLPRPAHKGTPGPRFLFPQGFAYQQDAIGAGPVWSRHEALRSPAPARTGLATRGLREHGGPSRCALYGRAWTACAEDGVGSPDPPARMRASVHGCGDRSTSTEKMRCIESKEKEADAVLCAEHR